MKKLDFLIILSLLVLSSCSKGSFDLYSLNAERVINAKVDNESDIYDLRETLEVKARFSTDDSYSFIIVYPDLDIKYEGNIRNGENAILQITPGSHFREGEYKVILTDEKGNDKEASFSLSSFDLDNHPYIDSDGDINGAQDVSISLVDKDKNITSEYSNHVNTVLYNKAIFTYKDRFGTSITLEEDLSGSSNELSESLL